ncbi:hypothetical protein BJV78DRAFT_1359903 [Lactifluus subvellereus]|nr:hypothetical protein BJV78DRAFT_1359903 [Lactifluus subvellereus]
MSTTTHAVKNSAAALKKAADPWNKEDRETADRIASAAISVTETPSLDQDTLDLLSALLRRPFAELYSSHPATALRLSAAILATIIHDRIAPLRKDRDSKSRNNWEQLGAVLLAGVQDHVEAHSNGSGNSNIDVGCRNSFSLDRVKISVAQAFYSVLCNAFFSASLSIPLTAYSVSLRVSAYTLLSMTADDCIENKNKLRDSKILGGEKLGRLITLTKDYLALEQLLILLAYLLPPAEGRPAGRAERLRFLRDCFEDSTERGKDLIELLKYIASPDWEMTSDKIVDILARDISVAQPFTMKRFTLNGPSNPRLDPANRFYLDKTSVLFNCEDEDGKIEGMHVLYDSIDHVDISSSGTVVVQLSSPPLCHESLQMGSNHAAIRMSIMVSPQDVEHFVRTLRVRGMTSRIKLNGTTTEKVAGRTSVNISPTRLEFEGNAQSITSYQNKVKVVEEGVFQTSDPGDDIIPDFEVCVDKLQRNSPLLVKECSPSSEMPPSPALVATQETKIYHDGGCDNISSASNHQLSGLCEDSQKGPTTPTVALGPYSSPRRPDGPPLRSPRASSAPHNCCNGNHAPSVHSSPSEHPHHSRPSDKDLSDAIFGASDEELSSLPDTDSDFDTVRLSAESVQARRVGRVSDSSKYCAHSQRHRHSRSSARPTSSTPHLSPTQDSAPEQKLVPMVKGLRVVDSQDTTRDKSLGAGDRGAAAVAKRKKVLPMSEDETEAANCVLSIVKKSPPLASNPGPEKKVSRTKRRCAVTTPQTDRVTTERPKRACISTLLSMARTDIEPKSQLSAAPGQSNFNAKAKGEPTGGNDGSSGSNDRFRMTTPTRRVAEGRGTVRAAGLQQKRRITEGDMTVTPSEHGLPCKRARVGPENISSPLIKPSRNKKDTSMSKPRKMAPPRVRKRYRNRPKTERSPPGHSANPDVDYDEIPPPTAPLDSSTAKDGSLSAPPTGGAILTSSVLQTRSRRGRTILSGSPTAPDNKRANKAKAKQAGADLIQAPPPEVILEDDDPIQSFSSSPLFLDSAAVKSEPHVSAVCDEGVSSESLAEVNPPMPLDAAPTTTAQTCSRQRAVTERTSDITLPKTEELSCNATSHHSGTLGGDDRANDERLSISVLAITNDKVRESPKALASFDNLDGPTIVGEQPSEPYKINNTDETPRLIIEAIDLTNETPTPMRSPKSGCAGENPTFSHDVPASSPVLSKRGVSEDNTGSSVLDLADSKYRDFDVLLDSSLCLPSTRTFVLKRPPTPPPPRTRRKNVTFADSVVEEQPETQEASAGVVAPATSNILDEVEYLELSPEPALAPESPSRVDESPHLVRRLKIEPRAVPPSPNPASRMRMPTEPLPSLPSFHAPRQNRAYLTVESLSSPTGAKRKHHVRGASPLPAGAESMARGSYLVPIMAVLDEIHAIIKKNVHTRFERLTNDAVQLREQILAQIQADMSALLDEYIAAFNDLVNLEAKYDAFSRRRITAFTKVRNANTQTLASLYAQIQAHDRAVHVYARHTFAVNPLPGAVRRWL